MSKATVLVVEDNQDTLDVIKLMLEENDFTVITSKNCLAAFNLLTVSRPDIILTDLMTPEMTGLEFIYRMRRVSNFDLIPIVAISAYDKNYLAAAILAGAEATLHKPEDLDVLVETVKQILARHYLDRAIDDARLIKKLIAEGEKSS